MFGWRVKSPEQLGASCMEAKTRAWIRAEHFYCGRSMLPHTNFSTTSSLQTAVAVNFK
jgi:hypothetical protein